MTSAQGSPRSGRPRKSIRVNWGAEIRRPNPSYLFVFISLLAIPPLSFASKVTELLQQEGDILKPLEQLTGSILLTEQELQDAEGEVAKLDYQLTEAARRLKAVSARADQRRDMLRRRVRQMYKTSRGGFIRLALNAREGEDLFSLLSTASLVLRRDIQELKLYDKEQRGHTAELAQLRQKRASKERLQRRLAAKRAALAKERALLRRQLQAIRKDRKRQVRLRGRLSRQERRLLRQMEDVADRAAEGDGFMALKGKLRRPVRGPLAGRFGKLLDRETGIQLLRQGLTFRPRRLARVRAVAPGTVRMAGPFAGFGALVLLQHQGNFYTVYGFMARVEVEVGDQLKQGQVVGRAGMDPTSGRRALYFELRHGRSALDPAQWLQRR